MAEKVFISSDKIKSAASQAGFDDCGICTPYVDEKSRNYFRNWLENDFQGNMKYLENTDKRFNPQQLFSEVKSVVMVLLSYNTLNVQHPEAFYKISKYAYGEDYHSVIKAKLSQFEHILTQGNPDIKTFSFVDSSAVWEKYWAKKSGLGWSGKHTVIINKQFGSFCFLGGIFINAESDYDTESPDNCGSCELCIKACPTNALISARMLDTRKCISCLTIENKNDLAPELHNSFNNYIYGCDICQDVCPYNKNAPVREHFFPNQKILDLKKEDWETLDESVFNSIFEHSAVKRIGQKRLKRNIDLLNSQAQ
jgi:epoxyqueuosine reductase